MSIIDSHVHVAPDVDDRCTDALDLARRASGAGYGGLVFKSPVTETATMAALAADVVPSLRCWGGVVLNAPVGGLNPAAVETMFSIQDASQRRRGRVVWLPTRHAENHVRSVAGASAYPSVPLWVDDTETIRPALRDVFEVVAAHDGVLATGHIAPAEMLPVVRAARDAGVRRIVVTHVDHGPTIVPVELQRELARLGCFLEHCFAGLLIGPNATSPRLRSREPATIERIIDGIKAVGIARSIVSTDLGAIELPDPIDGMESFRTRLGEVFGDEVDRAVSRNCSDLLEP